jgi:hypothetical protein
MSFADVPVDPNEEYEFTVRAVLKDGTIVNGSRKLRARTLKPEKRVCLLGGRFPRLYLTQPIQFVQGQDKIEKGGDRDVPMLCDLLKTPELAHTRICVQGHVNFGQLEADAKALSQVL